jgi:hypothetical protein
MLLCVNAVKWQMSDDRVATFERRRHELWIKKVRRPEKALHHLALVLTIRREHDGTALCKSSTSVRLHGHEYKSLYSCPIALYIRMRSGVDRAGTALCTLSWLYKPLRV